VETAGSPAILSPHAVPGSCQSSDPKWDDRVLFTHVGRWPKGKASEAKYHRCSVRNTRYHLVSPATPAKPKWELYDVKADPGEKKDLASERPEVVKELSAAYDRWWDSVQPSLVNEDAVGPKENPFKTLYRKQFGDHK
jgi:hypothetical protein